MQMIKQLGAYVASALPYLALAAVAFIGMTDVAQAKIPTSPEIDPGSIGAAITLFVGGAMYLTSRRRAR
jgi:hypothetical protein